MTDFKNIKGGKELQAFLDQLPTKLEANIMRGAMRAGAKEIEPEVKQNVPIDKGDLRDSIRISTSRKNGKVSASVKAGNRKAWYAHIIEFTGAVPHAIKAKKGGFLWFGGIFAKETRHPGMKANPFMRPALDAKANDAMRAVGEYVRKRLTKQGLSGVNGLEVEE